MKKNNRNKLVPGLDSLESRELLATSPIAVPAVASAQIQMAAATKLKRFSETIYVDNALIGSSKTVDLKVRDFKGDGQFRRLLVSDLHGKLEKWNTKLGQWQNLRPLTLGQAARLPEAVLYRHTLGLQDKLRWTPGFSVSPDISGQTSAFRVTGIGKARALVTTPGVPVAVQDLKATPVDIGKLSLSWKESPGATSYTIKVDDGRPDIKLEKGTAWVFSNLIATRRYTFTVVPNNAAGSGKETQTGFGALTLSVDLGVEKSTTGLDGSIWLASNVFQNHKAKRIVQDQDGNWSMVGEAIPIDSLPSAMTTGLDGAIWVASELDAAVQRIVQDQNGNWGVQQFGDRPSIAVDREPSALTTGLDGAIWVASNRDGTVQRIVQDQNGNWGVQRFGDRPSIPVDNGPSALTTGLDGSIWVASSDYGTVQQIVQDQNGNWGVRQFGDRPSIPVDKGPSALTTGLDGSIWVASEDYSTIQRIVQDQDGNWGVQQFGDRPSISVDKKPYGLSTGLDGSIWVVSKGAGTVQKIVNQRGSWFVQGAAIPVGSNAKAISTGLDGSIWASADYSERQVWNNPSPPTGLVGNYDLAAGRVTLTGKAPEANGGTPVCYYTATAWQGATSQTMRTTASSFTFSGLDPKNGPVYFTMTATNFVGNSPLATLLLGTDGQPMDTKYRTTAVTRDGTPVPDDGLDGKGNTYSWEALGKGQPIRFGNIDFHVGSQGAIISAEQEIPVPLGNFKTLNMAVTMVNSRGFPYVKLTYTDGSTGRWNFDDNTGVRDWARPIANLPNVIATCSYRNQQDGTKDPRPVYLYGFSFTIPEGKTLKSITPFKGEGLGEGDLRILDIQMTYAPSISTQPTSQTANVGSRATFTAAATGNPAPTVKWQSSPDGTIWKDISGATANSYTTPTLTAGDNGKKFRAIYTNGIGSDATTNAATLTVNVTSAPVISGQPVSIALEAGQTATFTASATGNPTPKVQWQSSPNGSTGWADITGATSGTLSFTATAGTNGKFYRAVFTNGISPAATTKTAKLSIGVAPVIITASEMTIPVGLTSGMTVRATGSPAPTYSIIQGSLPAGVTLDSNTGLLSGRPAAGTAGSWPITIKANNGIGNGVTQDFSLKVTSTVTSFTVSKGLAQRSYIRYLDLGMDSNASALALLNNPSRVQLTSADLNGVSSMPVPLTGFLSVPTGQSKLAIDFGTEGLGNSRNTTTADGYYTLSIDLDGNGTFETNLFFFRLMGDTNGNREVTAADQNAVLAGLRQNYNANLDVNGDGVVNAADFQYVTRSVGRKLRSTLIVTA